MQRCGRKVFQTRWRPRNANFRAVAKLYDVSGDAGPIVLPYPPFAVNDGDLRIINFQLILNNNLALGLGRLDGEQSCPFGSKFVG